MGTLTIGEGATPLSLVSAAGTCSQGHGTPSLLLWGSRGRLQDTLERGWTGFAPNSNLGSAVSFL